MQKKITNNKKKNRTTLAFYIFIVSGLPDENNTFKKLVFGNSPTASLFLCILNPFYIFYPPKISFLFIRNHTCKQEK